jgi:sialidase-1
MKTYDRLSRLKLVRELFGVVCCLGLAQKSAAEVTKVTVFKAGEDGYHTYRIPSIVPAKNGDLLAFAEGRKTGPGDHGDIDLVLKRSSDGGKTWSVMQLVQDDTDDPTGRVWIGNPTPVVDLLDPKHPGRIWLVFTRSNEKVFVISSDDDGRTWSDRRDITATAGRPDWNWYAAGPVHAIQLTRGKYAGRLVAPCDHRIGDDKTGNWGSHLIYSEDHGATWKLGAADTRATADPLHPNECVAVELVDGRVMVNARDQMGSDPATRAVAYSSDGGESFDAPFIAEPQIVSPVVQNSLMRYSATDQGAKEDLLIYSGPGQPKNRRDLTILTSRDEGQTWGQRTVLHEGPTAYSDLIKLDAGRVGVLFEGGENTYSGIHFTTFGLEDLKPAK